MRELPKSLSALANLLTTPSCRAKQNHPFRTNRIHLQVPRCEIPPRGGADRLIPAISALTQIVPATPAESALTFLLNLKVFGISTYIFFCGWGFAVGKSLSPCAQCLCVLCALRAGSDAWKFPSRCGQTDIHFRAPQLLWNAHLHKKGRGVAYVRMMTDMRCRFPYDVRCQRK